MQARKRIGVTALGQMLGKLIHFEIMGDHRGSLVAIESSGNIPFEIKRVYYLFATTPGMIRGCHAHKHLKQCLISVSGSCKVVIDNGRGKKEYLLDRPDFGLYIEGLVWREMLDFSADCVMLVLASEHYDESDYIRDYVEFKRYLEEQDEI